MLAVYEATGTDRIRPAVVLTGAGVRTSDGHPDYPRSRCQDREPPSRSGPTTVSTSGTGRCCATCARAEAAGLSTVVVTFDRHPASVVRPESAPKQLTGLEQKLELLADCGIDRTLVVAFDKARAEESAEDFVKEVLVDELSARLVVVGEDFHFGHGRRGNIELLRRLGARLRVRGGRLGPDRRRAEPVSSTRIRAQLAAGRRGGGGPPAGPPARGPRPRRPR